MWIWATKHYANSAYENRSMACTLQKKSPITVSQTFNVFLKISFSRIWFTLLMIHHSERKVSSYINLQPAKDWDDYDKWMHPILSQPSFLKPCRLYIWCFSTSLLLAIFFSLILQFPDPLQVFSTQSSNQPSARSISATPHSLFGLFSFTHLTWLDTPMAYAFILLIATPLHALSGASSVPLLLCPFMSAKSNPSYRLSPLLAKLPSLSELWDGDFLFSN